MRFAVAAVGLVFSVCALAAPPEEAVVIVQKGAGSVGIYSTKTGASIATVETGAKPHELALSADRKFAYVTNYGVDSYGEMTPGGNTVSVVDLRVLRKVRDIDTGKYRRPHGIEVGRSGRVYVTTDFPAAVLAIDATEGKVVKAWELEDTLPHMLAVTRDEKRAFVACSGSGTVAVLDLETGKSVAVEVGGVPMGIILNKDESRAYATNRNGNAVAVIDTSTNQLLSKMTVPGEPVRLQLTKDARWMIVTDIGTGVAWVVDMLTFKPKYKIAVGRQAEGVSIDTKGAYAYLAAQGEDKVVKVRTDLWQPVLEWKTASKPDSNAVFELEKARSK